jgi:ABC-type dipeptide/oligopeptide/nickel transport system permease component
MPSIVLATFPLAQLTRYVGSSMVEALAQDYVRTARARALRAPGVGGTPCAMR